MTDTFKETMGSSEKFCLKWNDFERNASKSFSQLRQQRGLFDVTLVSSDQQQVSAHRLVLSACSDFFKTIFYSNTHSHPLLYLDGVDSREINLMLDYIYQGEVQIYQESLDRFLQIANKFKSDTSDSLSITLGIRCSFQQFYTIQSKSYPSPQLKG